MWQEFDLSLRINRNTDKGLFIWEVIVNCKKLMVILVVFLLINNVYAQNKAYGIYSEGYEGVEKKAIKDAEGFVVTKQQITPSLGMMPIFSESVIDDVELVKKVLKYTLDSSQPVVDNNNSVQDFSVDSFFNQNYVIDNEEDDDFVDIAPEGTVEILIYDRIKTYSELTILEYELELEEKNGKVISEEKYTKVVKKLQKIDEEIFNEVEKKADKFIDKFVNFIGKKAKKGDILALAATISGIREFIEGKLNVESDEKLEIFVEFLKKAEETAVLIVRLMEEDNTFKKYYLLYLTINNIFINEYKPIFDEKDIVANTEQSTNEVEVVNDSVVANVAEHSSQTNVNTEGMTLSKDIKFENLIENFEFESQTTMTQADIQNFLVKKGSCLKNSYRGKYPSEIIYRVCQQYNINPKLMLVTFQKEQSLISKKSVSESKLDWALGVGCYDNGTKNSKYQGFEKQIASAAKIYRHWFDDGKKLNVSLNGYRMKVNYGSAYQYMENEASYSLYRYTPHTVDIRLNVKGGGNYLFGKIYIDFWNGFLRE